MFEAEVKAALDRLELLAILLRASVAAPEKRATYLNTLRNLCHNEPYCGLVFRLRLDEVFCADETERNEATV